MTPNDQLLAEQQTYYRLRAPEYHDWVTNYMGSVLGPIVDLMRASRLTGQVLEIAPGTGILTEPLCQIAEHVTAIDAAPEMLEQLTRRRLPNLTTICADIFSWEPTDCWDAVFFSNWLAHVPLARFDRFWSLLRSALRPGGRVIFVDVTAEEKFIETDIIEDAGLVRRQVDGQTFNVVKLYWEPAALLNRLESSGWTGNATPIGTDHGRGFVLYDVAATPH